MLNVYCWRQRLHLTQVQSTRNISKIFWTYLHLGLLDRVVSFFPMLPVHSFRVVLTIEVQTIQIGVVTIVVPPGAFKYQGTVAAALVITTILGGKWHTTMITKGITSGTYQKKKKRNIGVRLFFRRVFASCKFHFLQQYWISTLIYRDRTKHFWTIRN